MAKRRMTKTIAESVATKIVDDTTEVRKKEIHKRIGEIGTALYIETFGAELLDKLKSLPVEFQTSQASFDAKVVYCENEEEFKAFSKEIGHKNCDSYNFKFSDYMPAHSDRRRSCDLVTLPSYHPLVAEHLGLSKELNCLEDDKKLSLIHI